MKLKQRLRLFSFGRKATMTFNLPEDQCEFNAACDGLQCHGDLHNIHEYMVKVFNGKVDDDPEDIATHGICYDNCRFREGKMNPHEENKMTCKEMSSWMEEFEDKLLSHPTNAFLLNGKKNLKRWIKRYRDSVAIRRKQAGAYFDKAWDMYPPPPKIAKMKGIVHKKGSKDKARGIWYDLSLDEDTINLILFAIGEFRKEWLKDQRTPLPHMYQWLKDTRWDAYGTPCEVAVAQSNACQLCKALPSTGNIMIKYADGGYKDKRVCDSCQKYSGLTVEEVLQRLNPTVDKAVNPVGGITPAKTRKVNDTTTPSCSQSSGAGSLSAPTKFDTLVKDAFKYKDNNFGAKPKEIERG